MNAKKPLLPTVPQDLRGKKYLRAVYYRVLLIPAFPSVDHSKSLENGLLKDVNGLQVNGGVFDRDFTKSLIIRNFDDVLKNPFRYVHLFLLHTLLSKQFPKIAMQDL